MDASPSGRCPLTLADGPCTPLDDVMTLHLPDHAELESVRLSRRGIMNGALVAAAAAAVPLLGAAPARAATTAVRFTVGTANVRSGPSTSYAVVRTVRDSTRLTGTLTSSGWLRLRSGEYVGPSVLTSQVRKVARWTRWAAPYRSGSGSGQPVVGTYAAGTALNGWWTPSGWFRAASGRYVAGGDLTATAPAGGCTGGKVLQEAAKYAGIYYVYGGASPSGFDCSGYTQYVHRQLGISLPRTVADQRAATTAVSTRRPGHLVTFGTYHAAIYAGDGYIWDSGKPGIPVQRRKLWTSDVSYRAVRGVSY